MNKIYAVALLFVPTLSYSMLVNLSHLESLKNKVQDTRAISYAQLKKGKFARSVDIEVLKKARKKVEANEDTVSNNLGSKIKNGEPITTFKDFKVLFRTFAFIVNRIPNNERENVPDFLEPIFGNYEKALGGYWKQPSSPAEVVAVVDKLLWEIVQLQEENHLLAQSKDGLCNQLKTSQQKIEELLERK